MFQHNSGHTLGLLLYTLLQGSRLRLSILFLIYRSLLILFILHKNIFGNLFPCRIVSSEGKYWGRRGLEKDLKEVNEAKKREKLHLYPFPT